MSFSNPAVFETMKNAKQGDVFEVTTSKVGEYTQWTSATKSEGDTAAAPTKSAPASAVRSTYETPEERATRQRLIVRQSSLGHAIEILTTGAKTPPDPSDVETLADRFVAYVYQAPDLFKEDNDIPF